MTIRPAAGPALIVGASVWEQEFFDHVTGHIENEKHVLEAYEELADSTDSPAFAYLARLILDDERRHHQLLRDLAETIRIDASMSREPAPIPDLALFRADRTAIRQQARRLLAVEREDNRELERLARELRDFRDTTLWQLVIRLLQADNQKHCLILEFIASRARD